MSARSHTPDLEPGAEAWLEVNREMSEIWPNIGQQIDPMPNAEASQGETGKYEKYFTKAPECGQLAPVARCGWSTC